MLIANPVGFVENEVAKVVTALWEAVPCMWRGVGTEVPVSVNALLTFATLSKVTTTVF